MRLLLIDFSPFSPPVTPISLGNVGAVARAAGHEVRVLSLAATSAFSPRGLQAYLEDFHPRLVGFSLYQRNLLHVRALAQLVKETLPGAAVVLGGPQATFLPHAALQAMPEVDFVSRGEGELVIQTVIEAVEAGTEQPVPGATLRTAQGECLDGPAVEPLWDLDAYPSPWLTGVLDPAKLDESIMLTSRGCCNACSFCYTPRAFGRQIRAQSVRRVLEDIDWVSRDGRGRLWFADPNFSFDKNRVTQILEGILQAGLKLELWIETRADMLDPQLITLMKRAGVHTVALGLESASTNVYPGLNKEIEPAAIGEAARTLLSRGLDVELFSQYALPGETRADALETLRFVKQSGVPIRGNSNAQQMQLYFGSQLEQHPAEHGIRPMRNDLPPYLSAGAEFETEWMSANEIRQVKDAWRAESRDGGKRVVS